MIKIGPSGTAARFPDNIQPLDKIGAKVGNKHNAKGRYKQTTGLAFPISGPTSRAYWRIPFTALHLVKFFPIKIETKR